MRAVVEMLGGLLASELGIWLAIPLGLLLIGLGFGLLIGIFIWPGQLFATLIFYISKWLLGYGGARVVSGIFFIVAVIAFIRVIMEAFVNTDFIIAAVWVFFFVVFHGVFAFMKDFDR